MADLSTLTDTFTGTSLGGMWTEVSAPGADTAVGDGTCNQSVPNSYNTQTYIYTTTGNMQGVSVFVKHAAMDATPTNMRSYFYVTDGTYWVRFTTAESGGSTYIQTYNGTDVGWEVPWDSTNHKWWKITESSGYFYFYTAPVSASDPPTPGDWTQRGNSIIMPVGMNLSACYIQLAGQCQNNSGTISWDGLNGPTEGGTSSIAGDDGFQLPGHLVESYVSVWGI